MTTDSVPPLIFSWGKTRAGFVTVIGFLFFSVCVHLLGFYVFHVVYQPEVSLPPSTGRITILPKETAEHSMFGRWLEAEDPAIAATPRAVTPDFSWIRLSESSVTQKNTDGETNLPPREVIMDLSQSILNRVPAPRFAILLAQNRTTSAKVKLLAAAVSVQDKTYTSRALAFDEMGAPTQRPKFLLGIDHAGVARFVFTEKSSGSAKADQQVTQALKDFQFERSNEALRWETAQVVWTLAGVE